MKEHQLRLFEDLRNCELQNTVLEMDIRRLEAKVSNYQHRVKRGEVPPVDISHLECGLREKEIQSVNAALRLRINNLSNALNREKRENDAAKQKVFMLEKTIRELKKESPPKLSLLPGEKRF